MMRRLSRKWKKVQSFKYACVWLYRYGGIGLSGGGYVAGADAYARTYFAYEGVYIEDGEELPDCVGDMADDVRSEDGSGAVQTISNKFPNDDQAGKRFNYTIENGRVQMENGIQNVDFVIDMDGNLHIDRGHSYLADGSSVQAAGTMKVNSQGYVRLIMNESGHFQPTTVQALNYPTVFRNAGLNIDNAWIRIGEFETSMSNYVIDSKVFYNGPIKSMP